MKKTLFMLIIVFVVFKVSGQKVTERAVEISIVNDYFLTKKATGLVTDRDKVLIPFEIPENTIRWFYSISAYRNQEDINRAKQNIKLIAQLTRIIDQTGTSAAAISLLVKPPGGDYCDLYVMPTLDDGDKFRNGLKNFDYYKLFSIKNAVSGIKEVEGNLRNSMYFIGIENPSLSADLHIIGLTH